MCHFFEKKDWINATTLQGQPMKYKHFDDITKNYKTDFIFATLLLPAQLIQNGCKHHNFASSICLRHCKGSSYSSSL